MVDEPSVVEEAAGEKLGVERWDRPLIFRDAADAAVDNELPYWLVLSLSGAIATLGLALNSSAVVIGAMLVAPLLGPIIGLSMALAVGDSRLALQTFAIVCLSLVVVIATAAALTAVLPFHTLTLEITSRIRPTTLDMGVAVCSGLVGALVAVARGKRLSAAIPGVAVAVALIPPLAVAGFGIAAGWRTDVVWGSLLLLGANLAGIVLSGVLVFLLIGMHRGDVRQAATRWHDETEVRGVAKFVCKLPIARRTGVFGTALGRTSLVLAFGVALVIPLTAAMKEVIRETRVRGAVAEAVELLEADGMTSVLFRDVAMAADSSIARVRVATSTGVSGETRAEFRRLASELAGEPIHLRLEQLPAAAGDASALQELLSGQAEGRSDPEGIIWPETLDRASAVLEQAVVALPLPVGGEVIDMALVVGGIDTDSVEVTYLAPVPLDPQSAEILADVLRRAVGHPALRVAFTTAGPAAFVIDTADAAELASLIAVLQRYPRLVADLSSGPADSIQAAAVLDALRSAGIDPARVRSRTNSGAFELRLIRGDEPPT